MKTIAFIGLGNMGAPMAQNLLKAEFSLKVFDLNTSALSTLKAAGAEISTSAAECVKNVKAVITMLPASQHVEDVYLGSGKVLESVDPDTFLIDCSTIAPSTARKVAEAAQKKSLRMIDAPVSGGVGGATAGTLTFIVGASKENFERAQSLLSKMGKNIFHAGENGAGQVAKICNNMLLAIHMIGSSEALQLGIANGLDPKTLSDIMRVSSGGNWSLEKYNPCPGVMDNVPSSKSYQGGFGVSLMLKDLKLSQEAVSSAHIKTPLGQKASELYAQWAQNSEKSKLDFSSIFEFIKTLS